MSPRRESRPRSRKRRLLLVLIVLALAASAALAAAWVWVESPSGQDRIRRGLEARGTSLLGRAVRIDGIELDLLPFAATLTGIEIDGTPGSDQPLFSAAAAHIRIRAWALLSRELRISELNVDTPVVHWDVAEGPGPALEAGGGSRLVLVIDHLTLADGSLELNHRRWNLDTSFAGITLGLQPVEGAPGTDRRRTGLLQVRGGGVRIEPDAAESRLPGALDFVGAEIPFTLDEDELRIDDARIELGNSELSASGQVTNWRRGEFALDGRLDLGDAIALSGIETAASDGGDLMLASRLTFGADPLRFAGTLSSPSLEIAGIAASDFSAEVSATADEVVVDAVRASLFDGSVSARIGVNLTAAPRAWRLDYEASGIDLADLTASEALSGFRFAGIGAGTGTLSWSDPLRETVSGAGSFDLSLPSETLTQLAASAAPALRSPPSDAVAQRAEAAFDDTAARGATSAQRAAPSLPLPVEAHAEYSLDAGTLVLQNASASLPRTRAEMGGTVDRDGSIAGRVSLQSDDLRMLDRFFNQIRRFRGELPVPQPFGIAGGGVITATIAGTLEAPTIDGTLEARSLSVANNPVGDVDGNLRLAGAALEIFNLRLERDGGRAEGEGRFRIGQRPASGPDYTFGLRLERFPMEVELPRLGAPLSVAGEATGELTLTGGYESSPSGELTVRGEAVRLNDLGDLSADVRIRLSPEEWVAERFEITGPRGRLTASGGWLRAEDTLQAYLEGVDIDASIVSDLSGAELPLAGTVRLEAQLTGAFDAPDAAATVRWTNAAAYDVTLGSVAASAELRGGSVAIAAIGRSGPDDTAVPPSTPSARGGAIAIPLPTLPDAGWVATLSADLQAPSLATLRAAGESSLVLALLAAQGYDPGDDLQVRGAVQVSGTGELGDWRGWTGSAVLAGFAVSRPGLTFAIPEPMTLELRDEVLRIDLPRLASDAGSIEVRASINVVEERWIEATASGLVSLEVLEVFTDELDSGGTLEVSLEAEGNVLSGEVGGAFILRDVVFAHPSAPWSVEGVNGTVRLVDGRLELEGVRGISGERRFDVSGNLPLAALSGDDSAEPVSLEATIDALPLRPLWQRAGPLGEIMTGGEASVTLSVQGRGTDWRGYEGRLDVRELRVDLTDLPLSIPAPVTLAVRDGGLEAVDPIVLQGPGTDLRVGGEFLLGPFRLDARLQGFTNLDPLNALTGSWGLAGRADIDVRVTGDPPDLSYDGTINVTSGLLNAPILQPIENISATLRLENRLLRIEQLTGSLGGSGARDDSNVAVGGEIQLVDGVPQRFTLNLGVDEALLRLQRGIRVITSADLVLEGTFESSLLSGALNIIEGEYTRRWEGENDLGSLSDAGVAGVDHPLARSVILDVVVRAPGDLRIVNNVADVELNADLRIRGTLAEPVLLGSTTVLDGSVVLNDQRYRFLRGSIEFQNPLRTEPSLDIAVETSIRQYLVTINVSGSPVRGDINATFISSPPLSDLQLIQLLTVGDAPDAGLRNEEDNIGAVGAQATSFLTRQYLNQVERGAQRVFGVDRLKIEPAVVSGSGDPTARVTLGKQVTPDLWVSWTTVLGTTDEQLVTVEYQLTRGIQITATREDDGSIGVDVRFDHRFR